MGHHFASFFSREEQFTLMALNRGVVYCSFRREFFATTTWTIPPTRWLAHQVLRSFSMKNEVTSVVLCKGEWQQPLMSHFPALCKVKVIGKDGAQLLPRHFPTLQITTLNLSESKIEDMASLEAFLNLETLYLPNDTNVYNIHALETLHVLKTLNLGRSNLHKGLQDLAFLKKLPSLIKFGLQGFNCELSTLTNLKLESLDITGCVVSALRPLATTTSTLISPKASGTSIIGGIIPSKIEITALFATLVNLQELALMGSQILRHVGFAPSTPLVNLRSLELGDELYADLSPLAALTELRKLRIKAMPSANWSVLSSMKKLQSLDQVAPITSMDSNGACSLVSLRKLQTLSSPNSLSPMYPLLQVRSLTLSTFSMNEVLSKCIAFPLYVRCPNVEILHLKRRFGLRSFGLSKMKKLYKLDMAELETGIHLIDYSPIAGLSSLSKLTLSKTSKAKNYDFLRDLTNLRELSMDEQSTSDALALVNAPHLEKLSVSNSRIEDISPLGSLRGLKELFLDDTNVRDVSCLRGLPRLTKLVLPKTADCSPLLDDYGTSLPSIREFDHHQHKCEVLDDSDAEIPKHQNVVIDETPGRIDTRPVPPLPPEYFKDVKHYF